MRIKKEIIVLISLSLIACVKENQQTEEREGVKTFSSFSASFEEILSTKVSIGTDGSVKWENWDGIGIFSDIQGPVLYRWDSEDRVFRGDPISGSVFYAVYPYGGEYELGTDYSWYDEENPTVIKIRSRTGGMLMAAKSEGNDLSFKHLGGLLHLQLKFDVERAFVTIYGNHHEYFDGEVDLDSERPLLTSSGHGTSAERIWSKGSVQALKNEQGFWDVFIPMPQITLPHGFKAEIKGYKNDIVKECSKATFREVSFSRGVMETYELFDVDEAIERELELVDSDRQALIALYNALDGDNWSNKNNWCSDKPLNEWEGVTTTSQGRVRTIQLLNNVNGVLPEEIGLLTSMESFYVYGGGGLTPWDNTSIISGPIPESIGNLMNLERFSISNHQLSGEIPASMGNLKSLKVLYLVGAFADYNEGYRPLSTLSGSLSWMAELPLLTNVEISNTNVSGPFPTNMSARFITDLRLQNNNLTGPLPDLPSIMECPHWISLQGNQFSGSIPANWASLLDNSIRDLTQFYISSNHLSGPVPEEILNHPNFGEYACMLLLNQKDGYKLDPAYVPASRYTFETLDGAMLDLGAQYEKADYTMIVRWAEWCDGSTTFIPNALELSRQFEGKGLQTIWSYAGGSAAARMSYMQQTGLDKVGPHIIECYSTDNDSWDTQRDHFIWRGWVGPSTPFVEIVNKEGHIVFITECGNDNDFTDYAFSHRLDELDGFLYSLFGYGYQSVDYSANGTVHQLQEATEGNGIPLVLMGDAFSDRLIADGTYDVEMRRAMAAFFSEEPYKSLQHLFNVYYVDVVSENEIYCGSRALGTWYGNGSEVGGDSELVEEYSKLALNDESLINDALIIVLMNRDYYAGTCYMSMAPPPYRDYGRGKAIAYFPTCRNNEVFYGLVTHEAGGHGFAKLADEYYYENTGNIWNSAEVNSYMSMAGDGWYKNIDLTGNPETIKWATFISDNRYEDEHIGVYEGACTFEYGAYRPTEESIMNHNTGGFNAPSRYAIWYRINKLAYGDEWTGTYEDFVEFDLAHRPTTTTPLTKSRNFVEQQFPPLHPPVIVDKDWREVVSGR